MQIYIAFQSPLQLMDTPRPSARKMLCESQKVGIGRSYPLQISRLLTVYFLVIHSVNKFQLYLELIHSMHTPVFQPLSAVLMAKTPLHHVDLHMIW